MEGTGSVDVTASPKASLHSAISASSGSNCCDSVAMVNSKHHTSPIQPVKYMGLFVSLIVSDSLTDCNQNTRDPQAASGVVSGSHVMYPSICPLSC